MGEAKRRKEHDPYYGKPAAKMRGLIINNPVSVTLRSNLVQNQGPFDPIDLRASLFYWDRLMWPQNRIVRIDGEDEIDYLESAGILYRPFIDVEGDYSRALIESQAISLSNAEAREPGVWSIGGGINSIHITERALAPDRGVQIALTNAIPIPSAQVPLAEILEFKARRRPELLAFRAHVEEMTQEISSSSDSLDALKRKLQEVDLACADLFKTSKEWQLPIYLSDVKMSMNMDFAKSIEKGEKAWASLDKMGFGETGKLVGATLAGATSFISLTPGFGFRGIKRPASPYKYLYLAQRELF